MYLVKHPSFGMLYTLNDGQQIPRPGLGVWQAAHEQAQSTIETALEVGHRSIDTAAIYQNEEGIGHALQQADVPREELFITTKM